MTTPLRLLIVDNSAADAQLCEREFTENGFVLYCERVDTPEALLNALAAKTWDVVISAFVMPHFSGLDVVRILSESGIDIPCIVVSGTTDVETAVAAMRAGASDYIRKGNLALLAPAVRREMADAEVRRKRRQADEKLEQRHKTLEVRVNEMVADLRQKDQTLIRQNRLAAMGEMVSHIAHQWRQPLNNIALIIQNLKIQFNSGMLTREEMDSDIYEAMEILLHMSQTIDDFRNFFGEEKEKQEFFISKAVKRAMALVAPTLNNNNIRVEIETAADAVVNGFQNEYAQVLLNIVSNSREAAIERNISHPRIIIRIAREDEHSVLYIRDNCGGIADDVISRIFDPYFTTRGPDKGTGIGLYMSKVIIEQNMAGHLSARNVAGGVEFRIDV